MNRLLIRRERGRRLYAPRFARALAAVLATLAVGCARGDDGRKHAMGAAARGGAPEVARIALLLQAGHARGGTARLSGGDTLHLGPSATRFYRARGGKPAWTDEGGLTDEGRALLAQLGRTDDDGLSPARYHYGTARRLASMLGSGDDGAKSAAADLDVVLSEGFARYADDLAMGTLDPKQAGLEWHLAREHAPKVEALQAIASGASPDSVVRELRPHTAVYGRMMAALARYRQIAARGGWPRVGDGTLAGVRARLIAGEDPTEARLAAAGSASQGRADASLVEAIEHFQRRMGLEADGKVGPATLEAMDVPVQDRVQALAVNMDRWRWLPRDLGSFYVLVNLPAFRADVMEGDSTVMEQKVVVGKPGWTTPVFADRIVQLIVNPYWNVPKSIVAEELGPEMAKDPRYLARHHFQATADGGYRQMPGPNNSLGLYKFQLTNDEDIYLHDTPAKDLFGKPDRDLSHGCIRLQNARAMAYLLGEREGISPEAIDRASASGRNHVFDLPSPVPTYIMYFTAAVAPDGSVAFYPDVYGIDSRMAALMPRLRGEPVDGDSLAHDSAAAADSARQVRASHAGQGEA